MRFKRFVYSVLLVLFCLVLAADLALWFLTPEATAAAGTGFSQGGTYSGSDAGHSGADFRRPGRASGDSAAQAAETAEPAEAAGFEALLTQALPAVQAVRPYRVPVLIGVALGMALCVVRLAFLGRRIRRQQAAEEAAEPVVSLKRVALWPACLLLLGALVLAALLFPVNEEEESDGAVADVRILSGAVEEKTLTSLLQSAGSLEEQEAESLTVPASVTVASVCVKIGEAVPAGQIVAKVDRVSVMKAIVSVHEALAEIDGQLQKAHEALADADLTAPVAGTVKAVYAKVGQKAMDVMDEYGALMLLSLDGRMAVAVPAPEGMTIGTGVAVTLSDGAELPGEVTFLEEGVATVTVTDRGYAVGEQVSVKTADGTLLGSGPLFVHKAYRVTGYLGTVSRVYRREGSYAYAGVTLISLSRTADLAEYQDLLKRRHEYEEELRTLFGLYQTGYVHAPCDGVIGGLSDELAYTSLSAMVNGLAARHVSTTPGEADPTELIHYIGKVTGIDGRTVEMEQVGAADVADYSALPDPSGPMTGAYAIPEETQIYMLGGGWNPASVSDIWPGDTLLFAFDQEGNLIWVIAARTESSVDPAATPGGTGEGGQGQGQGGQGQGQSQGGQGQGQSQGGASSGGSGGRGWSGGIRIPSGSGSGTGAASKKTAYIIAEQELGTVTPQERMLLTVSIDELDILSLSLGQTADLYLDALPSRGFTATVTKISEEGENEGGNTKYSVTLAMDREDNLYPGMNGTVCFPRNPGRTAPTVPLAALEEAGNRVVIYTAYSEETDELLCPVEVRTGVSDGTDVEILSGLAPGDPYYYRYADSISYVTE